MGPAPALLSTRSSCFLLLHSFTPRAWLIAFLFGQVSHKPMNRSGYVRVAQDEPTPKRVSSSYYKAGQTAAPSGWAL